MRLRVALFCHRFVPERIMRTVWYRGFEGSSVARSVRLRGTGELELRGRFTLLDQVSLDLDGGALRCSSEVVINRFSQVWTTEGGAIEIGRGSYIGPFCFLDGSGRLVIAADVMIGPMTALYSSRHGTGPGHPYRAQTTALLETSIGTNVWIGGGVSVLGGATVGDHAIVGAGAVVIRDVPGKALAVGVPATTHRQVVDQ